MDSKNRCSWCLKDELYMHYHDTLWGVPEHDPVRLFEFLNLEGAQAGLSWYTVLCKKEDYFRLFKGWVPRDILAMSASERAALYSNPAIIRNRLKIDAVFTNAQAYLDMESEGENFSPFIWSFVDGTPILNRIETMSEVPAKTDISERMSKALKKKGFKFVGPTITYAFMQAVGMVNDHMVDCWRYPK